MKRGAFQSFLPAAGMNAIVDILAESLLVYRRAIGKTWLKLCAVLLPVNALLAWIHYQVAMRFDAGDGIPLIALRGERNVGWILQISVGLLAAVIICRAAWQEMAKAFDESEMTEGLGPAWGRAFGTLLFMLALSAAFAFMAFFCTMFAGIKVAEALSAQHEAAVMLMFGFVVIVVVLFVVLVSRWMLAAPLSAVFKMAGFRSTEESSALLRGRRWRSLLFLVLAGFVACTFVAPLRCIGLCDVLNIAHPFTECPSPGKWAWGTLIAVTGTLADIAALYGFVALVVYIRRLKEPIDSGVRLPRRLAVSLVATGLAFAVAVPAVAFIRSPDGFNSLDAARVFRMENMAEDETPSVNDIGWFLRSNSGAAWFEKRGILDLFSRDRRIWEERPFCRHCGREYSAYTECDAHGCDLFVRRVSTVKNNGTVSTVEFRDIRPRDSQRPATSEERERIMKRVEKDRRAPASVR